MVNYKCQKKILQKILMISILITNLFCYLPITSIATSEDDETYPALVPAIAEAIISKYVSTGFSAGSSNTSTNSTSNSSNSGSGTANEECNVSNGGYNSIFTSSTTGRQFREFKQNSANYSYPSIGYGCSWGSECGTVSTGIIGSGYQDISFQDIANELNANLGNTSFPLFLSNFTGQSISASSVSSVDEFANVLADGSVAIIHDWGYSQDGHYLAVLDISSDKSQVYISNPDVYDSPADGAVYQGWNPIQRVYNAIEKNEIYFVTNNDTSASYSGSGVTDNSFSTTASNTSSSTTSVEMKGNIVENNHNGYKINIDLDSEVQNMIDYLKHRNFKLSNYLSTSKQKEYLKRFIKSAIVTQYPDLRNANEITNDVPIRDDEVQGCIRIKRYMDSDTINFSSQNLNINNVNNDNGIYLSYIPYDDLSELITNGDKSALNYFSLDTNNNIVLTGWEELEVDVSIEQIEGDPDPNPDSEPEPREQPYGKLTMKSVNYLEQVNNYTMPFSLLWSLLVYGDDEDFVNNIAKLVIDTEIIIGCYDATSTKITTYTNTYEKCVTRQEDVYVNNQKVGTNEVESIYTYKVTEVQTLHTDNPYLKVKYADVWMATYNNDYIVKDKNVKDTGDVITLNNQHISTELEQVTDAQEISENANAQQLLEAEKENLKNAAHQYNWSNFPYRYVYIIDIINQRFVEAGDAYTLLQIEDVQNYIINMIIDGNTDGYIQSTFEDNEIIAEYAAGINHGYNTLKIQKDAASCVKRLVQESPIGSELWNKITSYGSDTRKNQTYSAEITSIQVAIDENRKNRTEQIDTDNTNATVENVTTTGNNVVFKTDRNSTDDNFVKLLYHSKKAKGNLKLIDNWFFESMEDTATIADMEDLLKYQFQFVYDGKSEFTNEEIQEMLNLFEPEKMTKVSTSNIQLIGGSVEEQVWNYLKNEGFSNESAAGIMGNMYVESYMDPSYDAGVAAGICMFEKGTGNFDSLCKYANSKGKNWTDLQCQLEFLMSQLPGAFNTFTGNGTYTYDNGTVTWWPTAMTLDEFKAITELEKATEIFCRVYEKPSVPHLDRRQAYAQEYYNMYHG